MRRAGRGENRAGAAVGSRLIFVVLILLVPVFWVVPIPSKVHLLGVLRMPAVCGPGACINPNKSVYLKPSGVASSRQCWSACEHYSVRTIAISSDDPGSFLRCPLALSPRKILAGGCKTVWDPSRSAFGCRTGRGLIYGKHLNCQRGKGTTSLQPFCLKATNLLLVALPSAIPSRHSHVCDTAWPVPLPDTRQDHLSRSRVQFAD